MVVLALVVFPINILAALAAFPPLAAKPAPLATPAVAADIAKVPAIDPFILKAPAIPLSSVNVDFLAKSLS